MSGPARAALDAVRLSRPARSLAATLPVGSSVLDFGCGHGTDVEGLSALGFAAAGWDPHHRPSRLALTRRYDAVLCSNVLNTLEPTARADIFAAACGFAPTAYFTVRADVSSISARWDRHADGWLTPSGTFQRIYTVADVLSEYPDAVIVHADPASITFRVGPEIGESAIGATP